jgi:hypothetical protein
VTAPGARPSTACGHRRPGSCPPPAVQEPDPSPASRRVRADGARALVT